MIPVTKPFLPDLNSVDEKLKKIFETGWLTNNGPFLKQLEKEILQYLNFSNGIIVANGTLALQLAIRALDLQGEIITTPFSYIATANSILWERCVPVFVDIDPHSWNIDPTAIQNAITDKTVAIIATHVFGNPCEVELIQSIAQKSDLKVIYDAAHAFGVNYKGKSIFGYGDISTSSYHATKIFHMVEGGGIFSNDTNIINKCRLLRNFGHTGEYTFNGLGINAKNSEFHAIMGISVLSHISNIMSRRKQQYGLYKSLLSSTGIKFQRIDQNDVEYNYSYFPILMESPEALKKIMTKLNENGIYPRRYFYPSLDQIIKQQDKTTNLIFTQSVSIRILCLPIYHELTDNEIVLICDQVKSII